MEFSIKNIDLVIPSYKGKKSSRESGDYRPNSGPGPEELKQRLERDTSLRHHRRQI